ncbi:hypothetical protein Bca4012_010035 [Brassica carinata]
MSGDASSSKELDSSKEVDSLKEVDSSKEPSLVIHSLTKNIAPAPSMPEEQATEPSMVLLEKHVPTVEDVQQGEVRYQQKRKQSPYAANNTAKVIIPNNLKLFPGYNPFAPIDNRKLKELADWLKTDPHYRTPLDKKPHKSPTWWYNTLRTSVSWLEDCVNLLL